MKRVFGFLSTYKVSQLARWVSQSAPLVGSPSHRVIPQYIQLIYTYIQTYVCMCVYMYTYIHICRFWYTYEYIYVYIHIYIHIYVYTCTECMISACI